VTKKRQSGTKSAPVRVTTRPELQAKVADAELTNLEENVIRMRYGLGVSDDHPVGGPMMAMDSSARSELADLEARALQVLLDRGDLTERDILSAQIRAARAKD